MLLQLAEARLFILLLLLSILSGFVGQNLSASTAYANDRPPWTEQASFVLGDTLYAVGVASNAVSSETGRQAAFMNGLEEIKGFGQVSNLDGLFIETQMTYEEGQGSGRVSVWRLLRLSIDGLRSVKATKPAVSQVLTINPPITTDTPRTADAAKPPGPLKASPATITRQPAVTTQQQEEVNLPTIPLRYPKVITGWTRNAEHGLTPKWEDKPRWQGQIITPSYSIY